MSDQVQEPGSGIEPPEATSNGGSPPDGFDGRAPVEDDRGAEDEAPASGSLPPRAPASARPAREATGRRPIAPIVGAVLLGNVVLYLAGVLCGWALSQKGVLPPGLKPEVSRPSPPTNTAARPVEAGASRSEVEGLRAEVASLDRRLAQLQGRLDQWPEPEPAPDLGPLQARVDDLAKAAGRLADVPESLEALDRRVGALDKATETVRQEVASLQEQVKEAEAARKEAEAARREAEESASARLAARGAALFKQGEYARARDAFLEQARATPDDARLWYYTALANGLATRDWGGETERLVLRGVEREQAGTPGRAEIDALFADLTREQGKEWLAAWRQRVVRR